jgi:hypothetical protein
MRILDMLLLQVSDIVPVYNGDYYLHCKHILARQALKCFNNLKQQYLDGGTLTKPA